MALRAGGFTTEVVERAVARGCGDPAAGVGRVAVDRPPLRCPGECLGDGVFGEIHVPEHPNERRDATRVLGTVDLAETGRVVHAKAARVESIIRLGTDG